MRLIDADATKRRVADTFFDTLIPCVNRALDDSPTVDAVPVVRCRDCQHWKPSGSKAGKSFLDMEYIGGCEFSKYCRRESDFCSYGEPKET